MGFKKIDVNDLKTIFGFNLIGMPQSFGSYTDKLKENINKEEANQISKILLINEEFIEINYNYDGIKQSLSGHGNLTVLNGSTKDRIWDSKLKYKGSQYSSLAQEGELILGIMEPKSNKTMRYDIESPEESINFMKVTETTEVLNEELESVFDENKSSMRKNILISGKENIIKFSILIENTSDSAFENIEFKKTLFKDLYDFQLDNAASKQVKIQRNSMFWKVNTLYPKQKEELSFSIKVFPTSKQNIRTGENEVKFSVKNNLISDLQIEDFSAFSHAFHAIEKEEINDKPNYWNCHLVFENHSEFPIKLRSVMVKNDSEECFKLEDENLINPGENFSTSKWEIKNENEPSLLRKLEYSVDYIYEKTANITVHYADDYFETVDYAIEKIIPKSEIKSFEEATLQNAVKLENKSSIPIQGIVINEVIPEDFLIPLLKENYILKNNNGEIPSEMYDFNVVPNNEDPSQKHTLEVKINLREESHGNAVDVEDKLELIYPIKAISPDNVKSYEFPLEVNAYFSKGQGYYILTKTLASDRAPSLKISHKRRNVVIGKEIFPGRSSDEFAINILVKNKSNTLVKDLSIKDTYPNSFKLISANTKYEVSEKDDSETISFNVDSILPYQEKEIMYYLKTIDNSDINYQELESVFYG